LRREIDLAGAERTRDRVAFVPRADIYETGEGITVLADMPGVDETSVDITLENNVLTIRGYVDSVEPEGRSLAYSEYRVGDYERAFSLSDQIDQDGIDALVKGGVLRLYLPKITEARRRTIAIRAG
jgi:HSP20 family molecular chaperone IbpA